MTAVQERLAAALADRYRIERELGAGGMATVFLAQDLRHNRRVAVKVLRPELAAVIGAERFLSEITTTANLQHPHILPLFDSGEADGFLFYVMPFIEGETVRDRLRREKQLPVADAVRIATEVAAALDYAHRRNVIHRDIKPENILLHDGSALVADFGIALAASKAGGTRMTETGMSLGTPHYMSPEQAMGEREITARSDVYALGCVLYEMLLGEPPFTGPTAQSIVAKVMSDKPARLTARRERIPPQVEDAVLTALEKLPADRFGTAAEFAAVLAAPAGSRTRRDASARGGRWLDWRMAAVAGLLVGAAITALAERRAAPAAGTFGTAGRRQLTFNGRSGGPAISPDGGYVAYVDRRCPRGRANPCVASLLVQDRGSDRPVVVLGEVPSLSAPRFAADGLTLVVSAQLDSVRAGLFAVARLGGVPRRIAPAGVFDTHATADSALVVTSGTDGSRSIARIIALPSGAVGDSIVLPEGSVDAIGWSPDGRLLALVESYARLTIVRRDGSIADSLRGPFRANVRWTPGGRAILLFRALPVKEDDLVEFTIGRDGRIEGTGEVQLPATQTLLRGEFDIARRTGQLVLATGSAIWDLWTFDLGPDAGPARQRTSGTTWYGTPSISPDGLRVFYLRGDATGDNLYMLAGPEGEEALTAERHPGAGGAKVSGDGRTVGFGHSVASGYRFGQLDLASRQVTFTDGNGFDSDAVPTPHRPGLVFLRSDHRGIGIVTAPAGERRWLLAPDSMQVGGYAVSPAGDSIALLVSTSLGVHLAVSPLDEWRPRWLHDFPRDKVNRFLSWSRDGGIYFWLWKLGDDTPGIWRSPAGGGVPARQRSLPTTCNTPTVDIAVDAPRGVCHAEDIRSDIWVVNVPGVTR
ncbi:hypothetical protein BH24GEM1_BH24GEM1_20830 [soil metagenome]